MSTARALRRTVGSALYTAREALSMARTRRAAMGEFRARPARSPAERHLTAAIQWLCAAQQACPDGGVSYGYDLRKGWMAAYPETTGYIIPTLFDYAASARGLTGNAVHDLRTRASALARWLTTVQLDCGAIPGGTVLSVPQPTVFNTGQVLDGWCRTARELADADITRAICKAARWLVSVQDNDGCWRRGLSPLTPQTPATYNVRSAAALLAAAELLGEPSWQAAATLNPDWVLTQQRDNGWFDNNCVSDNARPLTHTIGYTLEGLLHFAARPGGERYLAAVRRASDALLPHVAPDGFLSGQFDPEWKPVASWNCLTGASQLAMVWFRLGRMTGEPKYVEAAHRALNFVKRSQRLAAGRGEDPAIVGGIKGSHPVWGRYEPFAYPNWATKFFADAVMASLEAAAADGPADAAAAPVQSAAGLRVAYVVEDYPTFIVSEVAQLRRLGADVTLLSAFRPQPEADPMKDAFRRESVYLPARRRDILAANVAAVARTPVQYLSVAVKLLRERESLRFVVLGACHARIVRGRRIGHLHGTFGTRTTTLAYVVARLAGVGYSFTTHAYDVFRPNASLVWKTNAAEFMRTISQFNKAFIEHSYPGLDAQRVRVVHLGVDSDAVRPKHRHTARAVTRVLAIGSLIEQKGHLVLLRSCERLVRAGVDFECHIIGEGPLRGRLEREIAARRLERHVGLRGSLPHDLTMAELEQADIFALPCIDMRGRGEHVDGIPIVLMEAMAVGLPVVSTRLSGIPELIESGIAGVLVAPEDHDAIAAALEQLVASPALRESFGRAARARVIERFDLARNTAALARLMRTAAG